MLERELTHALAAEPDNAWLHALYSLTLTKVRRLRAALRQALEAVRLDASLSFAHSALALAYSARHELPSAEAAIGEALRLAPYEPDHYALLAGILHDRKRWPQALEAAHQGLRLLHGHEGCLRMRALALIKLGSGAAAKAAGLAA